MKNKERKELQVDYARKNIEHFFSLLDKRFRPEMDSVYIKEILKLSEAFNIRLSRESKLKVCKKCFSYMDANSREIRFDSKNKMKEYICKKCGNVKRFGYSSSSVE